MDPKERKRQRDRYTRLTCHQKEDGLLTKCREAHRRKKVVTTFFVNVHNHGQMEPKQFVQDELQCTPTPKQFVQDELQYTPTTST
jgi:hypothetical protein